MTLRTYNLLLVEDHPLVRRALRRLLGGEPDLVVAAEADSAESALAQLEGVTPDLVVTDLSLPGASGIELVQVLKHQRPGLRCLVLTGHSEPFHRAAALAAGAWGFVTKDEPDEVVGAVRRALHGVEG